MKKRADDRLKTSELAAAGQGATMERSRTTGAGEDLHPGRDEVRVRAEPIEGQEKGRLASREDFAPLFSGEEATQLRSRWEQIQTGFVDEPRHSVEQADELVAQVMKRLAQVFADERGQLEQQWTRGDDVSTEDLRVALRRYRSFFDRLLSI